MIGYFEQSWWHFGRSRTIQHVLPFRERNIIIKQVRTLYIILYYCIALQSYNIITTILFRFRFSHTRSLAVVPLRLNFEQWRLNIIIMHHLVFIHNNIIKRWLTPVPVHLSCWYRPVTYETQCDRQWYVKLSFAVFFMGNILQRKKSL